MIGAQVLPARRRRCPATMRERPRSSRVRCARHGAPRPASRWGWPSRPMSGRVAPGSAVRTARRSRSRWSGAALRHGLRPLALGPDQRVVLRPLMRARVPTARRRLGPAFPRISRPYLTVQVKRVGFQRARKKGVVAGVASSSDSTPLHQVDGTERRRNAAAGAWTVFALILL